MLDLFGEGLMNDCNYPSCMRGGQGCDRESICDAESNKIDALKYKIKSLEAQNKLLKQALVKIKGIGIPTGYELEIAEEALKNYKKIKKIIK